MFITENASIPRMRANTNSELDSSQHFDRRCINDVYCTECR